MLLGISAVRRDNLAWLYDFCLLVPIYVIREVTEFTSGEGPGIFVCGGENFDKAPPARGVKLKVPPLLEAKKFRSPPL